MQSIQRPFTKMKEHEPQIICDETTSAQTQAEEPAWLIHRGLKVAANVISKTIS